MSPLTERRLRRSHRTRSTSEHHGKNSENKWRGGREGDAVTRGPTCLKFLEEGESDQGNLSGARAQIFPPLEQSGGGGGLGGGGEGGLVLDDEVHLNLPFLTPASASLLPPGLGLGLSEWCEWTTAGQSKVHFIIE